MDKEDDISTGFGGWHMERKAIVSKAADVRADIVWIGEVAVDYGARPSFDELNGKWFDWTNNDLRNLVPVLHAERKGAPTKDVETARYGYVHLFGRYTETQALANIKQRGVKPATDLEAMYFGKRYPEEQRQYPIVALGSFFRLRRSVGCAVLDGLGRRRYLYLAWGPMSARWDGCRFLVRD